MMDYQYLWVDMEDKQSSLMLDKVVVVKLLVRRFQILEEHLENMVEIGLLVDLMNKVIGWSLFANDH